MNFTSQTSERMSCPRCEAAMNHHADKTMYPTEADTSGSTASATGGFIDELHACPNCGASASRPTRQGDAHA
jgi:ribosomal protein S27AE